MQAALALADHHQLGLLGRSAPQLLGSNGGGVVMGQGSILAGALTEEHDWKCLRIFTTWFNL